MAQPSPSRSSEVLFGVLAQCLKGASVGPADYGAVAFHVIGLVEESWLVRIDAEGAHVSSGTEEHPRATVFCSQAQLEALVTHHPPQEPLRIAGDRRYFERVTSWASDAQDVLSIRVNADGAES